MDVIVPQIGRPDLGDDLVPLGLLGPPGPPDCTTIPHEELLGTELPQFARLRSRWPPWAPLVGKSMAGESDSSQPDLDREELSKSSIPTSESGSGPRAESGYNTVIREESEPATGSCGTSSSTSDGTSSGRHMTTTPTTRTSQPTDNSGSNNSAASLEWVNSTIQSLAAGKNAADRKRVRSHVMAQRNRKKRQEEVERYQKLKTKSTVQLRPAPAASASSSADAITATTPITAQNPANAGNLPSHFVQEQVRPHRSETPIKMASSISLASRKRAPESQKRNTGSRETARSTGPGKDAGMPMIKREPSRGRVYGLNGGREPTNEELEDFRLVKREESFTPSPLLAVPPWSYVGQGSSDPFGTMATKLTGRMQDYLHYYVNIVVPVAYPLCRSSRFFDRYNWGEFAQENPGLLHGLISGAAIYQGMAKGIPPPYGVEHFPVETLHPITVDSLYHKGEAIRLVNEKLSNPVEATTNATVVAITVLLIGEIFKGHYDQILMHLEGLRRVVAMRRSLGDFPWPVVCQIKIADIKIATIQLTKPIFPFPRRFYSSPTSTAIDPGPDLSKQGTHLFSPKNTPFFHEDLLSAFHDLIQMVWYAELIRNSSPSTRTLDDIEEDYLVHQIIYIEHRLIQFPFDRENDRAGRSENKIETACRFVCLLFTQNVLWGHYTPMSPLTRTPIMALRQSFGGQLPDLNDRSSHSRNPWATCHDIFFWVMFIGAHSSRDHPERPFFVDGFAEVVRILGLTTCEEARELLLGFFYTDYRFWESLREVWGEAFGHQL